MVTITFIKVEGMFWCVFSLFVGLFFKTDSDLQF